MSGPQSFHSSTFSMVITSGLARSAHSTMIQARSRMFARQACRPWPWKSACSRARSARAPHAALHMLQRIDLVDVFAEMQRLRMVGGMQRQRRRMWLIAISGERPSAISIPVEAPPPPAKLSTIRGRPCRRLLTLANGSKQDRHHPSPARIPCGPQRRARGRRAGPHGDERVILENRKDGPAGVARLWEPEVSPKDRKPRLAAPQTGGQRLSASRTSDRARIGARGMVMPPPRHPAGAHHHAVAASMRSRCSGHVTTPAVTGCEASGTLRCGQTQPRPSWRACFPIHSSKWHCHDG